MHPKRTANKTAQFVWVGDKELKKLQRKAWDAGWWPERKTNGMLWQHPTDITASVMLHGTCTDHHAFANARSRFKKRGLDV